MSGTKGKIEGILFAWSEPLTVKELAKGLNLPFKETERELRELAKDYEREDRGLRLLFARDTVQLSTKPEDFETIKGFYGEKKKKTLSNAALETLSVIAYRQPVTRPEIEDIRGVSCDAILRTLEELGYIEERGRLDRPGKPKLYGTTTVFLRKFGLEELEDLPPLKEPEKEKEEETL